MSDFEPIKQKINEFMDGLRTRGPIYSKESEIEAAMVGSEIAYLFSDNRTEDFIRAHVGHTADFMFEHPNFYQVTVEGTATYKRGQRNEFFEDVVARLVADPNATINIDSEWTVDKPIDRILFTAPITDKGITSARIIEDTL